MPRLRWPHRPQPREVGAILEAQIRGWTLRQAEPRSASVSHWPVVTVSLQSEVRDSGIVRRIAERLGFSHWDREINAEVARALRIDEETVARLDLHASETMPRESDGSAFQWKAEAGDYAEHVRRIVTAVSRQGRAVISGHGAQFIVNPRRALRLRLVCPLEPAVVGVEEQRASFVLHDRGQDATAAAHYDLVLNTQTFDPETTVTLVVMAYLAKFRQWPAPTQAHRTRFLSAVPSDRSKGHPPDGRVA